MSNRNEIRSKYETFISNLPSYLPILVIGGGLGWLIGLSVSPVVAELITALMALIAALITGLSGLSKPEATQSEDASKAKLLAYQVDPFPLTALIIGLVVGSYFGISARNNLWFGSEVSAEVQKWSEAGLEMEQKELAKRLFEAQYPPGEQVPVSDPTRHSAGLMASGLSEEQCDILLDAVARSEDEKLVTELAKIKLFEHLPNQTVDIVLLKRMVVEVICLDG